MARRATNLGRGPALWCYNNLQEKPAGESSRLELACTKIPFEPWHKRIFSDTFKPVYMQNKLDRRQTLEPVYVFFSFYLCLHVCVPLLLASLHLRGWWAGKHFRKRVIKYSHHRLFPTGLGYLEETKATQRSILTAHVWIRAHFFFFRTHGMERSSVRCCCPRTGSSSSSSSFHWQHHLAPLNPSSRLFLLPPLPPVSMQRPVGLNHLCASRWDKCSAGHHELI